MIAETVKNNIGNQIIQVISYAQNLSSVGMIYIDDIMNQWEKAKEPWLEAWGGPILKCQQITFNLTDEEKEQQFDNFVTYDIENDYCEYDLADFLKLQGWKSFFENKVSHSCLNEDIPIGSKIIKSFKYFVEDEDKLRRLQDKASVILQNVTITGTLYLSVHPLDFLSISENTYNWRSCHALDGDYCVGNLNYILDNTTIVAYISDGKERKLPHFPPEVPWNSKKWRMLVYSHMPDISIMFAGRQYPIFNKSMLDAVKMAYLPSMDCSYFKYSDWSDLRVNDERIPSYKLYSPYIYVDTGLYPLYDMVNDCQHFLGYDDVLNSHVYQSHYCYRKQGYYYARGESVDKYKIKVGHTAICPYCGRPILQKGIMCCEDCYQKKKLNIEETE